MKSNSVWGENRVFNDHHFVHCIIDPSFYNFNGYAHTFIGWHQKKPSLQSEFSC
jgi:hypothetical protein